MLKTIEFFNAIKEHEIPEERKELYIKLGELALKLGMMYLQGKVDNER